MPTTPFVPRPNPSKILWPRGPSDQFTQLAASTLGNTATPADGWDALIAPYAAAFALTDNALRDLEFSLELAEHNGAALNSDGLGQLAGLVNSDTGALTNMDNALQSDLANFGPPPALPATPGDVSLPGFNIPGGVLSAPSLPNPPTGGPNVIGDLEKILQGLGAFAKSLISLLTKTFLAIPIWGWVLAGVATVIALLWGSADPRQVPAAETEQVFELAADGFHRLFLQHFLDLNTVGQLYASLIGAGAQREQALAQHYGEVRPFQNGITNMTRVIHNLYQIDQAQPNIGTNRMQLIVAQTTWNAMPKGGFYPQAVTEAHDIYFSAINSILENQ